MKDTLRKLAQHREEEGQQVTARLDAVFEKIQQQRDATEQAKYEAALSWRLKLGERAERREQEVEAAQEERNRQYRAAEERADVIQQRVDEHLGSLRQKAEAGKHKFEQKRIAVTNYHEQRQADTEAAFRRSTDHLNRARDEGAKLRSTSAQSLRDATNKRKGVVNKNLEALNQLFKGKAKAVYEKMELDQAGQNRNNVMQEEKMRRTERREMMRELFLENRDRMGRSDSYHHGHSLRGISNKVDKVNNVLEQRREILDQRADTLKESLMEKDHLNEMMASMKTASPDKVNKLLKAMDMPLVEVGGAEEKKEEK